MGEWERCNETLPEKDNLYGNLHTENITDTDYMHPKRSCIDFEIKNLGNIMICILKVIHYCWQMFLKTLEKWF